jgi:hypothetical protein
MSKRLDRIKTDCWQKRKQRAKKETRTDRNGRRGEKKTSTENIYLRNARLNCIQIRTHILYNQKRFFFIYYKKILYFESKSVNIFLLGPLSRQSMFQKKSTSLYRENTRLSEHEIFFIFSLFSEGTRVTFLDRFVTTL